MKQTEPSNWGECYYDHYETYFGTLLSSIVFRQSDDEPSIQILVYDNIFGGCRSFCSLGLTHYDQQVCGIGEVIIITDGGWEDVPSILANTLFLMVDHRKHLRRGSAISGLEQIKPLFAKKYNKAAVYLTDPFGLSDEFSKVRCGEKAGKLLMGFFISSEECAFLAQHGVDEFESLLETKQVDIFSLSRSSCL